MFANLKAKMGQERNLEDEKVYLFDLFGSIETNPS